MKRFGNEPICYDDHGAIPLDIPFSQISREEISLYLQLDTRVGNATCRQRCSHCFFFNQPGTRGRSIDLLEGRRILEALSGRGYKVFPVTADSFAGGGEFLRVFGNGHVREYHELPERRPAKTMRRGEAWTSGAPLMDDNWLDLLALAVRNDFGSVTITFHGILNSDLEPESQYSYPLKRVFPADDFCRVIERIRQFNGLLAAGRIEVPPAAPDRLHINVGVTLGTHNSSLESLRRYAHYFNRIHPAVVRFNRFQDYGGRHPELVLSRAEVAAVYRDLKLIHESMPLQFQLGLSEDFGTSGVDVMGFPPHVGQCRAGRQLFAIVPSVPCFLSEDGCNRRERMGDVAACVDAFQPRVGQLVRETRLQDGVTTYDVDFFYDDIELLRRKRLDGTYRDGCFAAELLAEGSGTPPRKAPYVINVQRS